MPKEKTYKNFPGGLKISKEYSELIPPISKDDYNQLFVNIVTDGYIRNPIVIDQHGNILDGHVRYKIAEILDMTFKTFALHIDNVNEGKVWVVNHQLGRR